MPVEIKTLPKDLYFKKGQRVELKGKLYEGFGTVKVAANLKQQPKGELMLGLSYDEPFPQIIVSTDTAGRIHYNADDILIGLVKSTNTPKQEPLLLRDLLHKVSLDFSQAGKDLGYGGGKAHSLQDALGSYGDVLSDKMLDSKVLPLKEYNFSFGEFDYESIEIVSEKAGEMMRHHGQRAFKLTIGVSGYAHVNSLELTLGEIY